MPIPNKRMTNELAEYLAPHAEKMTGYALANPIAKCEDLPAAIGTGNFGRGFEYNNVTILSLIITVGPYDDHDGAFWHASLSFRSAASMKAKSFALWTKKEKQLARDILLFLLQKVGQRTTAVTGYKKISMHCYKELTDEEKNLILGAATKPHDIKIEERKNGKFNSDPVE